MDWDVVYRDRWSGRRRPGTVCAPEVDQDLQPVVLIVPEEGKV